MISSGQICTHSYDLSQLDLFDYLLERDDCPSELRLIRGRLTSPSPVRAPSFLGRCGKLK
jgi:hypothetical protein